jgi:hypothetical protein
MQEAMDPEEFYQKIDEMRGFMHIVLKIAFNHFHHHQDDPRAK